MRFSDLDPGRIFCGSDGASICWDASTLKPISLGEYGEERVCDLFQSEEYWQGFIERKLEKAYIIESEVEKCIFAVQFVFEAEMQLVIANLGDNLIIQDHLSIEVLEGERAKLLDVQLFQQ